MNIVMLTGAGISAESGIKTFRDSNGLWEEYKIEDVATVRGFLRNPSLVNNFYNSRREELKNIKPNNAHFAISEFQKNNNLTLITQNIDNLHESAGSSVIHMHGELLKARCANTNETWDIADNITETTVCPCCSSNNVRPDVVWFGEMPMYLENIQILIEACDIFVAVGTSGNVYPAANFVKVAKDYGAHTVLINIEHPTNNAQFDEVILGSASVELPKFLNKIC